jgi:hypothetical protein
MRKQKKGQPRQLQGGGCSQEEARNGEATERTQQKEQMFTGTKQTKIERCPTQCLCPTRYFFLRFQRETYVKKL